MLHERVGGVYCAEGGLLAEGEYVNGVSHDDALFAHALRWGWILVDAIGRTRQGAVAVSMGVGVITFGTGRILGVLLHVTRVCSRGMVCNVGLVVGLCVSMTGGASVI
jgi:hypothetical protein